MYDLVALGEVLIDFTYYGLSEHGGALFEQNPGGAPANVLAMAAGLGLRTAFIGKVGADMHGDFLRQVLKSKGIDVAGLVSAPDVFTTMAFVKLDGAERHFSFARKPGADMTLRAEDVDFKIIEAAKIFHFGSLSLTDQPARDATIRAIEAAKAAGAVISYDPNYRPDLWPSVAEAKHRMRDAVQFADIIKISDEETELLTDKSEPEAASFALLAQGVTCVIVTLGADGALVATKDGCIKKAPPMCAPMDTTGAGDAFLGGFLYKLLKSEKSLAMHGLQEIEGYVDFANAAAGLCVEKRGAMTAMPDISAICERLDTDKHL